MTETARQDISDTIRILMQLDKQSLLLIDSGARLLMARQDMDKKQESGRSDAVLV